MAVKEGWTGRVYEDFEPGDIYPHPLGRTVTTADNIWFTMMTQNTNPIHFDHAYAAKTEFKQTCAHKRLRLPGFASAVAYGVDATAQACGIYLQKFHVLSEMNKTIACSVARAKTELGYEPKVALEEGMRRSLKWVAENGLL